MGDMIGEEKKEGEEKKTGMDAMKETLGDKKDEIKGKIEDTRGEGGQGGEGGGVAGVGGQDRELAERRVELLPPAPPRYYVIDDEGGGRKARTVSSARRASNAGRRRPAMAHLTAGAEVLA